VPDIRGEQQWFSLHCGKYGISMSEMGPLPEQEVFSPRIPLGDLRDAIRMDHRLPPLYEPESPPIPRSCVRYEPSETPVLHGGRAAYLIPLVIVVAVWQMNEHAGIAIGLFFYGALIAMSIVRGRDQ
jgi:hypothetical protein